MSDAPIVDAYVPAEIARRVESIGVKKARTDHLTVFTLAVLAGAFISLGGIFYVVVGTDPRTGFGLSRVLGGIAFSLGLILVVVGGAELFTGNNLLAMAWASKRIGFRELLRNWAIVYLGNVAGSLATFVVVWLAQIGTLGDGQVGAHAATIALGKVEADPVAILARAVLCNALVCLAVWLAFAGRSLTDKAVACVFPVAAFVAVGFEHSIANWFLLPLGMAYDTEGLISLGAAGMNLFMATIGNIIGGSLLVAGVYWLAYLRPETLDSAR